MRNNPKQLVLTGNYYVIPKGLMSAKTFVSKVTGEHVELTMIDKVVFMHLIDMISFHNEAGRTMHESMSAIADAVDTSAKSVSRSVSKLIEHALVLATLVSKASGYTYHAADVNQQWERGDMIEGNKQRMRQPTVKPVEVVVEATPDDVMPEWVTEAVDAPQTVRDDIEDHMHTDRHVSNVLDFDDFGDVVGFP